jgi:hypothetical protein
MDGQKQAHGRADHCCNELLSWGQMLAGLRKDPFENCSLRILDVGNFASVKAQVSCILRFSPSEVRVLR